MHMNLTEYFKIINKVQYTSIILFVKFREYLLMLR